MKWSSCGWVVGWCSFKRFCCNMATLYYQHPLNRAKAIQSFILRLWRWEVKGLIAEEQFVSGCGAGGPKFLSQFWQLTLSGCLNYICIIIKVSFGWSGAVIMQHYRHKLF